MNERAGKLARPLEEIFERQLKPRSTGSWRC